MKIYEGPPSQFLGAITDHFMFLAWMLKLTDYEIYTRSLGLVHDPVTARLIVRAVQERRSKNAGHKPNYGGFIGSYELYGDELKGIYPVAPAVTPEDDPLIVRAGLQHLFKSIPRNSAARRIKLSYNNILFSIAKEKADYDSTVHHGVSCNSCGLSPIRGIRWHCANCVDCDLCDVCEIANTHPITHDLIRITIPIPLMKSPRWRWKQRLPAKSAQRNFVMPSNLDTDTIIALNRENKFSRKDLDFVYKAYAPLFNYRKKRSDGTILYGITKSVWTTHMYHTPPAGDLATFIFRFYDQDGDGLISVQELIQVHMMLTLNDRNGLIKRLFRAFDWRGRGYFLCKDIVDLQLAYYNTLDLDVLERDSFLTGVRGQEGFWESRKPMSARFPIMHYVLPSSDSGRMIDTYIKSKYMNIKSEPLESRKQVIERFGVEDKLMLEMLKQTNTAKLRHFFELLGWREKTKIKYHNPSKSVLRYFCEDFYETFTDWVRPQKPALV